MKRIILLVAAAQIFGCAPGGDSSSSSSASGSPLLCEMPAEQEETVQAAQTFNPNNEQDLNKLAQYENFIVKYKDHVTEQLENTEGLTPSGNPVKEYKVTGIEFKGLVKGTYTVSVKLTAEEKKQFLADLMTQQEVEYVEPDYPVQAVQEAPPAMDGDEISESTVASQWSLRKVLAEQAWKTSTGSKDIVVGVIDSGIDYTHQDLKNNMWVNPQEIAGNGRDDDGNGYIDDVYGWNFNANNNRPTTTVTSNHGSHVAGIIGGNRGNGLGILGMAKNVKMMALKFIGDSGTGATSGAIKAIDYAIKKRVFAINNSWGSGNYSSALKDAITRAQNAGILFVVAAGNNGDNLDSASWYPAAYTHPNILNVAATTASDVLSSFTNYSRSKVDVAAPGSSILSTVHNGAYQTKSGTSMAAPLVTGLAVLVKAANPNLNALQVINVIRSSVDKFSNMTSKVSTGGRVNAAKAVALAALNSSRPPAPSVSDGTIMSPTCP